MVFKDLYSASKCIKSRQTKESVVDTLTPPPLRIKAVSPSDRSVLISLISIIADTLTDTYKKPINLRKNIQNLVTD